MTDEASVATRLRDEQTKALNQSTSQVEKWEQLKKEYQTLQEKLSTLPQKIEHKMMIPVGSVGLFPGKLIHTNEITVLLGDNWFVQRSASQASEIVNRRIAILDERLADAKKEVNFLEAQRKLTDDISAEKQSDDIVEIKEEEKTGVSSKGKRRIAHISSHNLVPRQVRKFDEETRKVGQKNSLTKEDSDVEKLFARLDELELEEKMLESRSGDHEERDDRSKGMKNGIHIDNRIDNGLPDGVKVDEQLKGRVHFGEITDIRKSAMGGDNHSNSTEINCIKFSHTSDVQIPQDSSPSCNSDDAQQKFQSPADIYKHFMKPNEAEEKPLKSILKKERKYSNEGMKPRPILKHSPEHKAESPSNDDVISHTVEEPKPILKSGPEAVSSIVLEKQVDSAESNAVKAREKKPVSRFKASRMKKN